MTRGRASFILTAVLAGLMAFAVGAAGGCDDQVDQAFNCFDACDRYRVCFDQSHNVGACEDRCEDRSSDDPSVLADAEACAACIGRNSCLSLTFNCPGCANIVP